VVLTRDVTLDNGEVLSKGSHFKVIGQIDTSGTTIEGPILTIAHRTTPFIKHTVHRGAVEDAA